MIESENIILPSKMNSNINRVNEKAAILFLRQLKLNRFIKINDLPNNISFEIINLIDEGFSSTKKAEFNNTFDEFIITLKKI